MDKSKYLRLTAALIVFIITIGASNDIIAQSNIYSNTIPNGIGYFDYVENYNIYVNNTTTLDTIAMKHFNRTAWFWDSRIGVSNNGNYSDIQKIALQYSQSNVCSTSDPADWKHVGPDVGNTIVKNSSNIRGQASGLISCVVGNVEDQNGGLNSVLISASSSGIWKYNINNSKWECKTDMLRYPGLAVSSIERNSKSSKHNHYFASTGISRNYGRRYGLGLIKSIDGGNTWSIVTGFPNTYMPSVEKVIFDKNDVSGNTIYAITQGSIYKSIDEGNSWVNVDDVLSEIVSFYDNLITNTTITRAHIGDWWYFNDIQVLNNGKFLISVKYKYGITKSSIWKYDPNASGNKWTNITSTIAPSLTNNTCSRSRFSNIDNGKFFVRVGYATGATSEAGYIYMTTDNGSTWTQIDATLSYGNKNVFEYSPTKDVLYIAQGGGYGYHTIENVSQSSRIVQGASVQGHVDVRDFYITQGGSSTTPDILLVANDGGLTEITYTDFDHKSYDIYAYKGSSLAIGEYFGIGVSNQSDKMITGAMHNNSFYYENGVWNQIGWSDGSDGEFDPVDDSKYYYIQGNGNGVVRKEDGGSVIYESNVWFRSPIEIYKTNHNKLVVGLFKTPNDGGYIIYDRSTGSKILKRFTGCSGVQAIALNQNDEMMYAYHTVFEDSSTPKLFITSDEGVTNTNLSTMPVYDYSGTVINNLNNILAWKEISDIIFSSENPNEVWIGISGAMMDSNGDPKPNYLRVLHSTNKGQTWIDYSNGLPAFPINTFEYIEGRNGLLFVGTDVGVFYRDNSMNSWECFSNNLPVTIVTDIDYKSSTSEIFISTYGRGLWKSHIPCQSSYQTLLIDNSSGDQTWSTSRATGGNVHISDGKTLTINNGAIISMGADNKIIVEPGSRLIIDNATVTSGCGSYWAGIEVWGNDNASQTPISNQGLVEVKNGGTIRNANMAIRTMKVNTDGSWDWSSNGGIVRINGAKLINNNNSIWIGSYHSPNRSVNISYITNSEFELNNDINDGHVGYSFIGLLDIDQISINGNSFINSQTGLNEIDRARGIVAYNAAFNVKAICNDANQTNPPSPCVDLDKNYFEGLYYGVYASNNNASSSSVVNIDQAEFVNVYHGVHLINTKDAVVNRSSFQIPENSQSGNVTYPYGVFLNGSDGYKVEENSFVGANTWTGGRGIVIDNSGDNNNQIYKNTFTNLLAAIQAQNDNRDDNNGNGLKLFCNDMSSDEFDIAIMPPGISEFQQISVIDNGNQYYLPAGDKFTYCNDNSDQNINNANSGNINYLSKQGDEPNCVTYNANDHTHDVTVSSVQPNNNYVECPSKISIGGDDIIVLQAELATAKIALNSSKVIYEIWKDGGNANLENEVETTQPWDVYVQFNLLLAKSPYLSEDVILATIENPAFTSLMIKLLMIANPRMNRNDIIMEAIYARIPALPVAYIEAINSGSSTASQLEILAANVSSDRHFVNTISNNIKRVYRSDYENSNAINILISFVGTENTLESQYELASLYLETEQFEIMNAVLNNINTNYILDDQQLVDLSNWQIYFGIAQSVKESGEQYGILSETQINSLETLANLNRPLISSAAIALLLSDDNNYDYHEVVLPITESGARMANPQQGTPSIEIENTLKVFPNPSYDYITLQYRTGIKYNKLWFVISDSKGSILMQQSLLGGDNEELVDISELAPNIYTLILYGDGERIAIEKITVIK